MTGKELRRQLCEPFAAAAAYHELLEDSLIHFPKPAAKLPSEREPAPLPQRDMAYRAMLGLLPLSAAHRDNLLARGLTDSAIQQNGYRTLAFGEELRDYISAQLSSWFDLNGIPGFYYADGAWRMCAYSGLLVPVRAADGCVQGIQIRRDDAAHRSGSGGSQEIFRIYCRDNMRNGNLYSRELVRETVGLRTNRYDKLANICYDRDTDRMYHDIVKDDPALDVEQLFQSMAEKFQVFRNCLGRSQVDTILLHYLGTLDALPISIYDKLYFVPRDKMHKVDLFEDFLEEINRANQNDKALVVTASMWRTMRNNEKRWLANSIRLCAARHRSIRSVPCI